MRNTANLLYVQIDNIDLPEERMCDVLICYTPLREVIVESSHKTKLCCLGNTSKRTVNVTPTPTPADSTTNPTVKSAILTTAEASVRRQTVSVTPTPTPADSTTNPTVKSAILTTAEASVRRQTVSVTPTPTPADSTTNPTVKSTILTTVYALSFSTGFCIIVIVILFIMHKKRIIRLKRLEIRLDRITAEITSSTVTSTAPLVRSLSDPAMSSTRLSEISMIDTSTNTSAVAPVYRYPTRLQSRLLH
ncbi:integumentary mucin C.1-like [Mercenaria mercenaria]|uniref:integumentary mucin C.1-like n=1 Tax=Mercenaria mercenaria TaxID=6596 RepID=UPI00234E50FB|nr:integumentary mucin C.1-like [Mercenaria mercenaria]